MDDQNRQDKIKDDICQSLKEGMFKKDAAAMAGIDESTFYRWKESDASFESRVVASTLEYKQSLIKNVNVQAQTDGRLALEVLQRRWPREWGKRGWKRGCRGKVGEMGRTGPMVTLPEMSNGGPVANGGEKN